MPPAPDEVIERLETEQEEREDAEQSRRVRLRLAIRRLGSRFPDLISTLDPESPTRRVQTLDREPDELFPELGALRFRSPQTRSRMSFRDLELFDDILSLQGLEDIDIEDFRRQERRSTNVPGLPFRRLRLRPLRAGTSTLEV